MPQAFRSDESLEAELLTRSLIEPFLVSVGCSDLNEQRKTERISDIAIHNGHSANGIRASMKVKLCWRRSGRRTSRQNSYAAAQLLAKVEPGTAEVRVREFAKRALTEGTTHLLVVQADEALIELAAMIPFAVLGDIWTTQRDRSKDLIAEGLLGRRTKNHAENGHSPTIYLHDSAAPQVAECLWNHPAVINLKEVLATATYVAPENFDDTFQDVIIDSYEGFGSDAPERHITAMSHVKRDNGVRLLVTKRAGGQCENPACATSRPYKGFLDVHHILGVGTSDRVWNCVAVCPNCHREAHIAPHAEELNGALLQIAMKSQTESPHLSEGFSSLR